MRSARSVAIGTLTLALLLAASARLAASQPASRSIQPGPTPAVTLRAASGGTIRFITHNGETVDGVPPQARDLPHLVLHRSGALTAPDERTLIVEVTGIEAPPGGVTVTLEVTTQHADPDATPGYGESILVWRESRRIANTQPATMTVAGLTFTHTFSEKVTVDVRETPTPTDYFGYTITIASAHGNGATPLPALEGDYAFLMENQVVAPLPQVQEESEGAAPDELVVYYCDMFPFRKGPSYMGYLSAQLHRGEVADYIRTELIPAMTEAYRVQSNVWGFPWHDAWSSYRSGENPEQLSIALTDGETWYHGSAPVTGHSGISLNTNAGDEYAPYDTLTDGLVSTFYHELFHNLQRSINQHSGGDGSVDADSEAWQFFSEGTAFLASSVGLPDVHFGRTGSVRRHLSNANALLAEDSWGSGTIMHAHGALYWRFLYEQCGGMSEGTEDPAAGMAVVRNALSALYSGDTVDITSSTDLLVGLPRVMDHALAETPSCPFRTFKESLIHFARAVYALRLDGGRCLTPGLPSGCGFYDPIGLYVEPPARPAVYVGADLQVPRAIRNSYGIAFVDVILDSSTHGQPLVLELEGAPQGSAEFSVQVWRLIDGELDTRPRPISEQVAGPEVVGTAGPGGRLTYTIAAIDVTAYNRLGLIITRVDANERSDPLGRYTIRLLPG